MYHRPIETMGLILYYENSNFDKKINLGRIPWVLNETLYTSFSQTSQSHRFMRLGGSLIIATNSTTNSPKGPGADDSRISHHFPFGLQAQRSWREKPSHSWQSRCFTKVKQPQIPRRLTRVLGLQPGYEDLLLYSIRGRPDVAKTNERCLWS